MERSSDGHGHPVLAVELDAGDERRPVAQVVAGLGAEGVLFVLALGLELELLLRPQRQAAVGARGQVAVLLEVGAHARRQDRPGPWCRASGGSSRRT